MIACKKAQLYCMVKKYSFSTLYLALTIFIWLGWIVMLHQPFYATFFSPLLLSLFISLPTCPPENP